MSMDEPERISIARIERVEGSISSPLLHAHGTEPVDVEAAVADAADPEFETPWSGATGSPRAWLLPAAVVLGIGAAVAAGDPRIGIVAAVPIVLVGLASSIDRHVPFSFGEGFIGYRSHMEWPRGVQEDDDVHWSWRPAQRPAHRISGR